MPLISVIAAIGKKERAICHDQNLLWMIPDDLKRLRSLTMGHTLVMGRKTYESIRHPLKGRFHVIVTRDQNYKPSIPEGYENEVVRIAHSIDEALELAKLIETEKGLGEKEIFIFGGGEIYNQTISKANKLYLTIVDSEEDEKKGDTFFPEYEKDFVQTKHEDRIWENKPYSWIDFERIKVTNSISPNLSLLGVG